MKSISFFLLQILIFAHSIQAMTTPSPTSASPASAAATGLFSTPTSASSDSASSSASNSPSSSTEASLSGAPILSVNGELNSFVTTTRTGKDSTITTGPVFDGDVSSYIKEKWHLTTYWSCNTFDRTYVDCGWHEPVLPGGTEIAAAPRAMDAKAAAFMAGAAVLVGAWLQ